MGEMQEDIGPHPSMSRPHFADVVSFSHGTSPHTRVVISSNEGRKTAVYIFIIEIWFCFFSRVIDIRLH